MNGSEKEGGVGLVGLDLNDPAIRKVVTEHQEEGHDVAVAAILTPPMPGLEQYGIVVRRPSLMQMAMLWQLMRDDDNPIEENMQPWVWIFTLAAPLPTVYRALAIHRKQGMTQFMVIVHEWWDEAGLPVGITQEVLAAVGVTFQQVAAMMPKPSPDGDAGKDAVDGKKDLSHGSSLPPT